MYVRVLGPIAAESGGEPVAVSANQRHLVALLAARAGQIVPGDELTEALWGDDQPQHPSAALQNLVSRIRARLAGPDAEVLVTRAPGYALEVDRGSLDRSDFEHAVERARAEVDPGTAVAHYDAALALWRGAPYREFTDCPQLRQDAVRLEELHASIQEERLALLVRTDPAHAVGPLEALVAASPYRERGHALLMEALYRTRRRRDALEAYTRYRQLLVEELGLDPSPELQALEHAILTDDVEPVVEPTRLAGPIHNLRARRTSFLGRSGDLAAVAEHLEQGTLVTLVGAGGAGKTSLATEVARLSLPAFPDGVWVVDLLQLADGVRIAEHVAATIGIPVSPGADAVRVLVDQLALRRALIVLDNCEHVLVAAAHLADAVLDRAPDIRLLATSREPLRVAGETVHRVEPLELPSDSATLDQVLNTASGRLFVDRVSSADTAFTVEDGDGQLIRSICRRLDGLPLALELAAARVPTLGLAEVAERLGDRFRFLVSTRRDAVPHHQTLRAAIEWSVDLLDADQRELLACLSVFAGSFTIDAAEAVCLAGEHPRAGAVDGLSALVDRSLVVASWDGNEVRYRLLETIRELVRGNAGDRASALRDRHRDWCVHLAADIGDGFLVETGPWYARLRQEFPNLRAAFWWAMEGGEVTEAARLAASLRWAPFNTGHLYAEHRSWIEASVDAARRQEVPPEVLGRLLTAAGSVAGLESRADEAVSLLSEAAQLLDDLGSGEVVWCHMWLGAFTADLGDLRGAMAQSRTGLDAAIASGSMTAVVYLANQHGENAMAASWLLPDPRCADTAREAYEIAVAAAEGAGIEEGLLRGRNGLALLGATIDPEAALAACEECLVGWRRLGHGNRLIMSLVSAARVALLVNGADGARTMLAEGVATMADGGWHQPLGRLLETAAVLALQTEDVATAALLAGGASCRFATPRWFVPIGADQRFAAARAAGPEVWDLGTAAGAAMNDRALMEVVRSRR